MQQNMALVTPYSQEPKMLETSDFEGAGPALAHTAGASQGRGAAATRILSRGQGLSRIENYTARGSRS